MDEVKLSFSRKLALYAVTVLTCTGFEFASPALAMETFLVNGKGTVVFATRGKISQQLDDCFVVTAWGTGDKTYINREGKKVAPPKPMVFNKTTGISEVVPDVKVPSGLVFVSGEGDGIIQVKDREGKIGYCDSSGQITLPPSHDKIRYLFEGRFLRRTYPDKAPSERLELVGLHGEHIADLPPRTVIRGESFCDGLLRVETIDDGLVGYINRQGEFQIKLSKYCSTNDFHEGVAIVELYLKDSVGAAVIDRTGKFVFEPQKNQTVNVFYDGIAVVMNESSCGVIDKNGKLVLPFTTDPLIRQGHHIVSLKGDHWVVYSNDGKVVATLSPTVTDINCADDQLWIFAEGGSHNGTNGMLLDPHDPNKKFGVMKSSGEIIVPARFASIGPFADGLAAVATKNSQTGALSWGVLNADGKVVVPCKYTGSWVGADCAILQMAEKNNWDPYPWSQVHGRMTLWGQFLREHDVIGMSKQKLLELLPNPNLSKSTGAASTKTPEKNLPPLEYTMELRFGCGNIGPASVLEFDIDKNSAVAGWRFVGHENWNRQNVVYIKEGRRTLLLPKDAACN